MSDLVTQVNIMYGLPGSGKTYFCLSNAGRNEAYLNLDELIGKKTKDRDSLISMADNMIKEKLSNCGFPVIWIDGLVTTRSALGVLMRIVIDSLKDRDGKIKIVVHIWNEDREACLYNDNGRREMASEVSIKYLRYEELNMEDIWKAAGNDYVALADFECLRHEVKKKPEYKAWFEDRGVTVDKVQNGDILGNSSIRNLREKPTSRIYSDKWCMGGTSGNYLGEQDYIDAETPPEFNQLFEILYQFDEDIPYRMVKRIFDDFVKTEKEKISDYYGGTVTFARYFVELEGLYRVLKERYE